MNAPRDPSRAWEAAIIFAAVTLAIVMLAVADLAAKVLK